MFPRSIFPFGLPLARNTRSLGRVAARVFKLEDFLGSAERLAWAKASGCPWDWRTCQLAAARGSLGALQWMREHGCRWNAGTCHFAARGTLTCSGGRGSTIARGMI